MKVESRTEDGLTIVSLEGRLDAVSSQSARGPLLELGGLGPVLVDASQMSYISSAGLRILLQLRKQQKSMAVAGLQPMCREIIEAAGLSEMFGVCDSLEQARAQLVG